MHYSSITLRLLILTLPWLSPVWGEEPLGEKLLPLLEAHDGKVGFALTRLTTGDNFAHHADLPMPTASLIKLPIMVEAYRQAAGGQLDLQERLTLREEDKVPGSGILTPHFSAGMQLPLRDAIRLMMAYSDNTATNLVLDRTGLARVNQTMEEFELPNTKIHSQVFRGKTSILPERSKQFGLGSTTAGEMVRLLELLWNGKLADADRTQAMLAHLRACEDKRLSRLLPSRIAVYQKTGSVTAVRTVAGILDLPGGPVAICLLTSENKDQRWAPDNAGEALAAKIGKLVYDHDASSRGQDKEPPSEVLKLGSQGEPVSRLQRLLNQKLRPSPDLTADGEFGPLTQMAVKAFQAANKLPETGELDAATAKALDWMGNTGK